MAALTALKSGNPPWGIALIVRCALQTVKQKRFVAWDWLGRSDLLGDPNQLRNSTVSLIIWRVPARDHYAGNPFPIFLPCLDFMSVYEYEVTIVNFVQINEGFLAVISSLYYFLLFMYGPLNVVSSANSFSYPSNRFVNPCTKGCFSSADPESNWYLAP